MQRVFYKDGTYIDCKVSWEYENDPDYDRTEEVPDSYIFSPGNHIWKNDPE